MFYYVEQILVVYLFCILMLMAFSMTGIFCWIPGKWAINVKMNNLMGLGETTAENIYWMEGEWENGWNSGQCRDLFFLGLGLGFALMNQKEFNSFLANESRIETEILHNLWWDFLLSKPFSLISSSSNPQSNKNNRKSSKISKQNSQSRG